MKTFDDYLNESSGSKYSANIGREGQEVIAVNGQPIPHTMVIDVTKNDITYAQKVKNNVIELHSNSSYFGDSKTQTIVLDKKSVELLLKAVTKL